MWLATQVTLSQWVHLHACLRNSQKGHVAETNWIREQVVRGKVSKVKRVRSCRPLKPVLRTLAFVLGEIGNC